MKKEVREARRGRKREIQEGKEARKRKVRQEELKGHFSRNKPKNTPKRMSKELTGQSIKAGDGSVHGQKKNAI